MTRQRSLSAYNAHTENAYQAVTNFCLSDLTTYRAGPTSLHRYPRLTNSKLRTWAQHIDVVEQSTETKLPRPRLTSTVAI